MITEEEIENAIFEIARRHGIEPRRFFEILYTILIGAPEGPRLSRYILAMGIENVIEALQRAVANAGDFFEIKETWEKVFHE